MIKLGRGKFALMPPVNLHTDMTLNPIFFFHFNFYRKIHFFAKKKIKVNKDGKVDKQTHSK